MKDFLASLGITNTEGLSFGNLTWESVLGALLTLLLCLVAQKLVMTLVRKLLDRPNIDSRVRRYTLSCIRALLWILTVLIRADSLGIPVTSLVALLSVFSLAASLAVQSVLANIAGGIVIMLNKPFKEGDYIETSSGAGTVQDITLNYTYLATFDGQRVVVPNSTISADRVINYTVQGQRRAVINVTASYDAPTETVRQACFRAIEQCGKILSDPAPQVLLSNYLDSSIEYSIRVWCKPEDYGDVYFPLLAALREAFAEAGVEMTYNHLNVHLVDK